MSSPTTLFIEHCFSPHHCVQLITHSESVGFEAATVRLPEGPKMITGIRNNERVTEYDADLALRCWQKLRPYLKNIDGAEPVGVNPLMRYYRYQPGQRFNFHKDGRVQLSDLLHTKLTLLVYLNDNFEGGETAFESKSIAPQTGAALLFSHELRHKGCAVTQGVKYALRSDILYCETPEAARQWQTVDARLLRFAYLQFLETGDQATLKQIAAKITALTLKAPTFEGLYFGLQKLIGKGWLKTENGYIALGDNLAADLGDAVEHSLEIVLEKMQAFQPPALPCPLPDETLFYQILDCLPNAAEPPLD